MKIDMKEKDIKNYGISNPYDKFLKGICASGRLAMAFYEVLPKELADQIDFSTYELLDNSYVPENLEFSFSDALLLFPFKNSQEKVVIALLLEHKSYADKMTLFQIGQYLMNFWARDFANNGSLRCVLPVLFYHIGKAWPFPLSITDHLPLNYLQNFIEFSPVFKVLGVNLEDLNKSPKLAPLSLLASARHFSKPEDLINWAKISDTEHFWDETFLKQAGYFVFTVSRIDFNLVIDILQKEKNMEQTVEILTKTLFDAQHEKGKIEGKMEVIKNLLSSGMTFEFISQVTGVPISSIKEELIQKK